jgi:opacity protein-like surface antigen
MMLNLSRASLALFVLLIATASGAQTQTVRVRVDRANLRVSATQDGRVVAVVERGAELDVLETVGLYYRVKVRATGVEGFISNGSVDVVASPTTPAAPPAPAPAPTTAPPPAAATPPPQTAPRPSVAPSSSERKFGVRAFFGADVNSMAAQKSFEAVLGTSRVNGFGGGADVIFGNAFVRGAVSRVSKSGNRAFVFNGETFSLGIPLQLTMTPIEIGGGWRFASGSEARVTPYAGAGVLFLMYKETSSFAQAGDDVSQNGRGFTAFGGVEIAVVKGLVAGAEAQYRSVKNILGAGGLSQDLGEQNLGGFTVRVLFGYRR